MSAVKATFEEQIAFGGKLNSFKQCSVDLCGKENGIGIYPSHFSIFL